MQRSADASLLSRLWRSLRRRRAALLLLGLGLAGLVVVGPPLKRRALWAVVNVCQFSQRLAGSPWPCQSLQATQGGRSVAVLQAPLEPGHILLVPTQRIHGLESPELAGEVGSDYLGAAWGLRDLAAGRTGRKGEWSDFAMAINGPWFRTQKQLHVHVECLKPRFARILGARRAIPAGPWVPLEGFHETFVRRWPQADLRSLDFRRDFLDTLPPPPEDEGEINVGAAGIIGPDGDREFLLLYSTHFSLERFLDNGCAILRGPASDRTGVAGERPVAP